MPTSRSLLEGPSSSNSWVKSSGNALQNELIRYIISVNVRFLNSGYAFHCETKILFVFVDAGETAQQDFCVFGENLKLMRVLANIKGRGWLQSLMEATALFEDTAVKDISPSISELNCIVIVLTLFQSFSSELRLAHGVVHY